MRILVVYQKHFADLPTVEFEDIKLAMKEVDLKIKPKEDPKNHTISKVRFELERIPEQKQENEEDMKESTITNLQISTTHSMGVQFLFSWNPKFKALKHAM